MMNESERWVCLLKAVDHCRCQEVIDQEWPLYLTLSGGCFVALWWVLYRISDDRYSWLHCEIRMSKNLLLRDAPPRMRSLSAGWISTQGKRPMCSDIFSYSLSSTRNCFFFPVWQIHLISWSADCVCNFARTLKNDSSCLMFSWSVEEIPLLVNEI